MERGKHLLSNCLATRTSEIVYTNGIHTSIKTHLHQTNSIPSTITTKALYCENSDITTNVLYCENSDKGQRNKGSGSMNIPNNTRTLADLPERVHISRALLRRYQSLGEREAAYSGSRDSSLARL